MPAKKCSSISFRGIQKNSGGDFEFYNFNSCQLKKENTYTRFFCYKKLRDRTNELKILNNLSSPL